MKRIGIFGGTFSPIHEGHIGVAKEMLKYVDEVHFAITHQNPFKTEAPVEFEHRLKMADLAIYSSACKGLYVSANEAPVYMADYLKELIEHDPNNEYSLIIGYDSYKTLHKWKDYKWITDNVKVYVYSRGGENNEYEELVPLNIIPVECKEIWDYSSTKIREEIANTERADLQHNRVHIDGLPDSVAQYIGLTGIYKTKDDDKS